MRGEGVELQVGGTEEDDGRGKGGGVAGRRSGKKEQGRQCNVCAGGAGERQRGRWRVLSCRGETER